MFYNTDTLMLIWSLPSYVTTPSPPTSPTNLATTHLRVKPHWLAKTLGASKCCGGFVDLALLQHYCAIVPGQYVEDMWDWEGYNQFKVEGGAVLDLGWQMLKRADDRSFD